jgi:hypothetical protein
MTADVCSSINLALGEPAARAAAAVSFGGPVVSYICNVSGRCLNCHWQAVIQLILDCRSAYLLIGFRPAHSQGRAVLAFAE